MAESHQLQGAGYPEVIQLWFKNGGVRIFLYRKLIEVNTLSRSLLVDLYTTCRLFHYIFEKSFHIHLRPLNLLNNLHG